jgi:hypothetical protein
VRTARRARSACSTGAVEADEPNGLPFGGAHGLPFDSVRDYADQLIHYTAHRNGHEAT